jgi:CBS-domain-containing membrane protein
MAGCNGSGRNEPGGQILLCEDEEVAHVVQNMAELQVRRFPVMNRDKRLVGIVSLGDLAIQGSLPKTARARYAICFSQSRVTPELCQAASL